MKFYRYKKCSTCVKAQKYLDSKGVDLELIEIRECPPTMDELNAALSYAEGNIKKLLNTSGQDYRSMGLKDKLPSMTAEELITLLATNGNLVKRPMLIIDNQTVICGFKEDVYNTVLKTS